LLQLLVMCNPVRPAWLVGSWSR